MQQIYLKFLNNRDRKNKLTNINSKVVIDFDKVKAPLSENLENFKLIGEIKKGSLLKILIKEILER